MTTDTTTKQDEEQVTFQIVKDVADNMVATGNPVSVRAVLRLTGGGTSQVTKFLSQWRQQRDEQNDVLARELGANGEFVQSLAKEFNRIVSASIVAERQKIESLEQQNDDFKFTIESLESDMHLLTKEAASKDGDVKLAQEKVAQSEKEARERISQIQEEAKNRVSEVESEASRKIAELEAELNKRIAEVEAGAKARVEAAEAQKDEKQALLIQVEQERDRLRDSNTSLTVEEAQRNLEKQAVLDAEQKVLKQQEVMSQLEKKLAVAEEKLQAMPGLKSQYETLDQKHNEVSQELAQTKAEIVGLRTSNESLAKEVGRQDDQLKNLTERNGKIENELSAERATNQANSNQMLQLQKDLQQSEREREQMANSLAIATSRIGYPDTQKDK